MRYRVITAESVADFADFLDVLNVTACYDRERTPYIVTVGSV